MIKFPKYKENLRMIGDEVWSYSTNVARKEDYKLVELGYWSVTTRKHVNYVANELNLKLIKYDSSSEQHERSVPIS